MAKDSIKLEDTFPVSCDQLYRDWLDSDAHTEFTGGEAQINNEIGGTFTAWDEYISGTTLELEPNSRIKQTWRSTEFEDQDEDSILEVLLEPADSSATKLIIKHTNIPEGQGERYEKGWVEHYFEPMHRHYGPNN